MRASRCAWCCRAVFALWSCSPCLSLRVLSLSLQAKHEHMQAVEAQRLQREEMYRRQLEAHARAEAEARAQEEFRQKVVEEARKRLLAEHAAHLEGYLPKGVLRSEEDLDLIRGARG